MNNILAVIAFLIFCGFLAVLIIHVPRLDLIAVIAVTVALAGWDLVQNLKGNAG
ncbi:hypothetical protein ACSBLW_16225 [Thioclava sp. FR2]|uniref:hypothetical protein n=1 Tax=Thioclava sp. FR2 TaxID=3445780 RepID=UPI003EB731D5